MKKIHITSFSIYNPNTSLVRFNSTNSLSNIINVVNTDQMENVPVDNTKSLINPELFVTSRKIEGPVLDASLPSNFSPWFLTGFADAEGNFDIVYFKNAKVLAQTGIKFRFRLSANYKDIVLLSAIRNYFGSGALSLIRKDTKVVTLEVSSIEIIRDKVIPFFDNYQLKGTKYYDYLIWKNTFLDFLENRNTLESKLLLIGRI